MVCTGPINYLGMAAVQGVPPQEAFIPAASPGILAQGSRIRNEYYPTTDAFLEALAHAMRQEYQAIVQAGFLLQVDSPDLADLRTIRFWDLSLEEYREKEAQLNSVCARSRPTATTASTPRIGG
jgi:5-methyltetrahydropteroyltriglutamate--homocysteine methyltransferase